MAERGVDGWVGGGGAVVFLKVDAERGCAQSSNKKGETRGGSEAVSI